MSVTFALFRKELRGFFLSPSFYLVCGLMTTLLGWTYAIKLDTFASQVSNMMYNPMLPAGLGNIHYMVFAPHLGYVNLALLLLIPGITMRLFSEEKKMHTMDLLMTSPITSAQIVIGKYFAALAAILAMMFIAFLYPLATAFFAKINWGSLVVAFIGIFLVGAVYAAMDLFCSSLTESMIASLFMAVIFNILIWFFGMGVEVVDSPSVRAILEHISLNTHLSAMVEGTVRTSGLIFIFSVIFLFCFLAERVVESSRWR